jgi:hypothetical protein
MVRERYGGLIRLLWAKKGREASKSLVGPPPWAGRTEPPRSGSLRKRNRTEWDRLAELIDYCWQPEELDAKGCINRRMKGCFTGLSFRHGSS